MKIETPKCKTCAHWDKTHYVGTHISIGLCTRYPPIPMNNGEFRWPETAETMKCGEYIECIRIERIISFQERDEGYQQMLVAAPKLEEADD